MAEENKAGDWTWVTHILALLLAVSSLGIVIYTVVLVNDADMVKLTMGFSTTILGVIMGFYFNRERLSQESRDRRYFSQQAEDFYAAYVAAREKLRKAIESVAEEPEE